MTAPKRSPMAAALRHFKQQKVRPRKGRAAYQRKPKHQEKAR